MSDVKKEVSSLSEEHLRQIDVEYAELNDSDIIERLAYLELTTMKNVLSSLILNQPKR